VRVCAMALPGLKSLNSSKKSKAPPPGAMDAVCMRWLGIPAAHAARIVILAFAAGAAMETFMVKAWIGNTNFYEVVKKKEAEKRAERVSSTKEAEEPTFADLVRQQWEEKKKALEQERTSRS